MTIYIASLKYSPVFKSHCFAFGKACEKEGYSVKYLLSREYAWMLSEEEKNKTVFIGVSNSIFSMLKDVMNTKNKEKLDKTFSEEKPTHIYMHNYHFLNHYIAELSKNYDSVFIYHVHEPYVENKKAHGGLQQYWLHLFEYFQHKLLRKTDVAIVSSNEASHLFDLKNPFFHGKKMFIPLMYEDLGDSLSNAQGRDFITFIGPPVPAKNPEKFLDLVRYSDENGLGLKFLLITRSEVKDARFFRDNNLQVYYKKRITEEEFGELVSRSIAVLTPYKRETQSSVVLVSYMYGTPVVSSNVGGLPEFVTHEKTGYLLDVDAEPDQWIKGIHFIQSNFSSLSKACRDYFVNNYSGINWCRYLDNVLKQ